LNDDLTTGCVGINCVTGVASKNEPGQDSQRAAVIEDYETTFE